MRFFSHSPVCVWNEPTASHAGGVRVAQIGPLFGSEFVLPLVLISLPSLLK